MIRSSEICTTVAHVGSVSGLGGENEAMSVSYLHARMINQERRKCVIDRPSAGCQDLRAARTFHDLEAHTVLKVLVVVAEHQRVQKDRSLYTCDGSVLHRRPDCLNPR